MYHVFEKSVFSPLYGNILTPSGWRLGEIYFNQRINVISGEVVDPEGNTEHYIIPGFIDLHVHGAGGRDMMEAYVSSAENAVHIIAAEHAKHGTTSLLATTMTAPLTDLERALEGIQYAMSHPQKGAARVLGVHLEGPYINAKKLGAQPDYTQAASLDEVLRLHAIAPIKVITISPEIEGHIQLIQVLTQHGIRVQLGHTLGTYEEGVAALENGAAGFTHLFNAMSRLDHRAPGMVGAALAHANYAEMIPDLLHVHPGAIKVALRSIPHLYCVTDSTSACGMPDGQYMLGRQQVHKCLGGVRLADGTLAGSTLTMDQALRNLIGMGLTLEEASKRVSTFAANYLGITERGRLQEQCYADMVVLDRDLNVVKVVVEGIDIELNKN